MSSSSSPSTLSTPPPGPTVAVYTADPNNSQQTATLSAGLPSLVAINFSSLDKETKPIGLTLWHLAQSQVFEVTSSGGANDESATTRQTSTSASKTASPTSSSSSIVSLPSPATSQPSSTPNTITSTSSTSQALATLQSSQLPPGAAGLKPSHAAGLAVGCILAGAIIAMAAASLIARRRRRRAFAAPARSKFRSAAADSDQDKRSSSTILRHIEKQSLSLGFDLLLAPPLPDTELLAMFKRLKDLIANHVERYLDNGTNMTARKPDQSFNQRLTELLGPGCLVSPQNLGTLLFERRTQAIGAKLLLAQAILGNIDSSGPPETTLFPPELSECMASMAGMKSEAQVRSTLLSKWRQITRVLMESTYGRGTSIGAADPRQINIRELADSIDQTLKTFTKESELDQRMQSLTEVIGEGAKFGYTIFTQPSEWRFEWKSLGLPSHSHVQEFVVFPAFCKVTDDKGQLLAAPEVRDPAVVSKDV